MASSDKNVSAGELKYSVEKEADDREINIRGEYHHSDHEHEEHNEQILRQKNSQNLKLIKRAQ